MTDKKPNIRDRFVNMIFDNGVSLTLAVAFCVGLYYIMSQQQEFESRLFIQAIENYRQQNKDLLDELLDCLKNGQ